MISLKEDFTGEVVEFGTDTRLEMYSGELCSWDAATTTITRYRDGKPLQVPEIAELSFYSSNSPRIHAPYYRKGYPRFIRAYSGDLEVSMSHLSSSVPSVLVKLPNGSTWRARFGTEPHGEIAYFICERILAPGTDTVSALGAITFDVAGNVTNRASYRYENGERTSRLIDSAPGTYKAEVWESDLRDLCIEAYLACEIFLDDVCDMIPTAPAVI